MTLYYKIFMNTLGNLFYDSSLQKLVKIVFFEKLTLTSVYMPCFGRLFWDWMKGKKVFLWWWHLVKIVRQLSHAWWNGGFGWISTTRTNTRTMTRMMGMHPLTIFDNISSKGNRSTQLNFGIERNKLLSKNISISVSMIKSFDILKNNDIPLTTMQSNTNSILKILVTFYQRATNWNGLLG